MLPCGFCFGMVAPLNLEKLDGAASGATFYFVQNADRSLAVGKIRLKVNRLVINVLVKIFCFGMVAPLNLEKLDGAASGATFYFVQNADRSLAVGKIRLKVNRLVINVLVKIRTTWRLETLPKL